MGFASKCRIVKLPESGVVKISQLKTFYMRLIVLDFVIIGEVGIAS